MLNCRRVFTGPAMQTLTPEQFKEKMTHGAIVLDVRLPEEVAIAALPGAINIPLSELPQRVSELNPRIPVAVLCHHGVRSEMAARFLERNGFADVCHLGGGIDAWSTRIDAAVPRY